MLPTITRIRRCYLRQLQQMLMVLFIIIMCSYKTFHWKGVHLTEVFVSHIAPNFEAASAFVPRSLGNFTFGHGYIHFNSLLVVHQLFMLMQVNCGMLCMVNFQIQWPSVPLLVLIRQCDQWLTVGWPMSSRWCQIRLWVVHLDFVWPTTSVSRLSLLDAAIAATSTTRTVQTEGCLSLRSSHRSSRLLCLCAASWRKKVGQLELTWIITKQGEKKIEHLILVNTNFEMQQHTSWMAQRQWASARVHWWTLVIVHGSITNLQY